MKINMRDKARSGHVTRWHGVRTGREQTIAEHHYMVAIITKEMMKNILTDSTDCDMLLALEYALEHDSPELLMGDFPTPAKRRIQQICQPHGFDPFKLIEDEIVPELAVLSSQIENTPIKIVVKLSDILDAILFISEEGIGRHARDVVTSKCHSLYSELLEKACIKFPQYNWNFANDLREEMLNGEDNQISFEAGLDTLTTLKNSATTDITNR
ncbi:MAG: HD domain-containing protein [Bdellovibrionales bacterium]|jgi:5'-deoxynucleotidase|nr:HD domain-containing protein [Bdellovibrionales bacterium]MBT3527016.1 HD domain-containing protein [Bdellovibrionales bacterium]MBT7669521.1 HD domain-containing protein [Bdellovibrionales bacterium]MBT7766491.1 HD domain-containing protein [Bdellovibrionales bacterium]